MVLWASQANAIPVYVIEYCSYTYTHLYRSHSGLYHLFYRIQKF